MRKSLFLAALLVAVSCASNTGKNSAPLSEDDPDFTYATELVAAGEKAPDFTGKTVVMDFWATWCPDCRKEIDYLVSLHKKFPDVMFVGVSFDTDKEQLETFVKEKGMDWLQLSEGNKAWKETKVSVDYGIKWIPTKYVISPKGKVLLSTVETEKVEAFLSK